MEMDRQEVPAEGTSRGAPTRARRDVERAPGSDPGDSRGSSHRGREETSVSIVRLFAGLALIVLGTFMIAFAITM